MGKGALMFVYNLDSNDQKVNGVISQNCMYDNGEQGSNISLWNNQIISPKTSIPLNGWQNPQYIEANGSGVCAFEQSSFTLGFDNGAKTSLNIQTALVPVTQSSQGNVVCSANSNSSLDIWSGQSGIGIMILPDPSTVPKQENYIPPNPATWMSWLNNQTNGLFFQQPLYTVSFPASHDSGMSISTHCTELASSAQTVTQTLDIGGQLNAGIRYFDLRPCVWDISNKNGSSDFYFGHFTEFEQMGLGCLGQNMVESLQQVVEFANENTDEIIILKFSHYVDSQYNSFPAGLQQLMISTIQEKLGNNIYTVPDGEKINSAILNSIIQSTKRIICVFDSIDSSLYNAQKGILKFGDLSGTPAADSNLDIYDNYSDSDNLSIMVADQIDKYTKFITNGTGNNQQKNGIFLLSYTLTQSETDAILSSLGLDTVLLLAKYADSYLWTVVTSIMRGPTSQQPPNLVYIDSVNSSNAISAAIYFNLQNIIYSK